MRNIKRKMEMAHNKCLLTHLKKTHVPTTLSFFKVMLPCSFESLILPPKFAKRAVTLIDQNTLLEDMIGQRWRVKLSIVDGSLAFREGWSKFVSDHCIEYGEFVVFHYIIGSHFIVHIFGKNGCERLKFPVRNDRNHNNGKKAGRIKHLPDCLPSDEIFEDAKEHSMEEEVSERSRTTLSNSSDFEMFGRSNADEREKSPTTKENSSQYDSGSDEIFRDAMDAPCQIVNEDSLKEEVSQRQSSQYGSGAKRTFDSSDTMNEHGGVTRSTAPPSDFEIVNSKCNAADRNKMLMSEEKSSLYQSGYKRTSHPEQVNEERAARTRTASCNSSDLEKVESKRIYKDMDHVTPTTEKSNADVRNKMPMSKEKSSLYQSGYKRTSHPEQVNEEGAARTRTASCNSSDLEKVESKRDSKDMDHVTPSTEKSSNFSRSPKKTFDASNVPCLIIDEDSMNEEGATRRKTGPSKLSEFEMVETRCNVENINQIPKSAKESSHYRNNSGRPNTACASSGGKEPIVKPKMEYAPDVGSTGSGPQKTANMDKCHKHPATIEEKDCRSEEEMDVDSCQKDELKAREVEKDEGLDWIGCSSHNMESFSCSVHIEHQSWLKLPTKLPPSMFNGRENFERKVILLLDSAKRVWPVLYNLGKGYDYHRSCLCSGWKDFAAANNIQRGDTCLFELVNASDAILRVRVCKDGTLEKCKACDKTVYVVDLLSADGVSYHKSCFKCSHCRGTLVMSNYSSMDGVLYCKPHFEQLFKETGNFSKNFQTTGKSPELGRTPSKLSSMFSGTQDKCATCHKTAYPLEKVSVEGESYHKSCFKCSHGGCSLTPSSYAALNGILYCKPHFAQLFKEKGSYNHLIKNASIKRTTSKQDQGPPPDPDQMQEKQHPSSDRTPHPDDKMQEQSSS